MLNEHVIFYFTNIKNVEKYFFPFLKYDYSITIEIDPIIVILDII